MRSENRWRGSPSTRRPATVSRRGNRNQNSFGTFRTAALPRVMGPATGRTSRPAIVFPKVLRQIPSATVAYAKNASPERTPYAAGWRNPRRNSTVHTGARTTTVSIANATTRFVQWTWSVRFWPMMSNPLTMSASHAPILGVRIRRYRGPGPPALTNGATQIAHHSSGFSVDLVITVAGHGGPAG